jgi:hypothetical protein
VKGGIWSPCCACRYGCFKVGFEEKLHYRDSYSLIVKRLFLTYNYDEVRDSSLSSYVLAVSWHSRIKFTSQHTSPNALSSSSDQWNISLALARIRRSIVLSKYNKGCITDSTSSIKAKNIETSPQLLGQSSKNIREFRNEDISRRNSHTRRITGSHP